MNQSQPGPGNSAAHARQDTPAEQDTQQHDESLSTAEKVLMGVSALFTVALFLYVFWQILFVPAGTVDVTVEQVEQTPRGDVVTVQVNNNENVGLLFATVTVTCNETTRELDLDHIPASGIERGHVTCPQNSTNTAPPTAVLTSWQTP